MRGRPAGAHCPPPALQRCAEQHQRHGTASSEGQQPAATSGRLSLCALVLPCAHASGAGAAACGQGCLRCGGRVGSPHAPGCGSWPAGHHHNRGLRLFFWCPTDPPGSQISQVIFLPSPPPSRPSGHTSPCLCLACGGRGLRVTPCQWLCFRLFHAALTAARVACLACWEREESCALRIAFLERVLVFCTAPVPVPGHVRDPVMRDQMQGV